MGKIRYSKKSALSALVISSLFHTQVMAASNGLDVGAVVGTGLGIVNSVTQAYLSQKQMLAAQAQSQAIDIQKSMMPNFVPSKYFPECKLPAAMSPIPQNACQPTNNSNQLVSLYAYEKAAAGMVTYFDQMLNEVAHESNGIGVSCMQRSKKEVDSQLTEMINNITRLQTELKERSQAFKVANKLLISQLEEVNTELMGTQDRGSSSNSVKGKTRDFSKLVSSNCQRVLGNGYTSLAESNGFNGLLKSMTPKSQAAQSFLEASPRIQSEIENSIQKTKDSISNNGLDVWATQDNNGFGRAQMDIADKLSSFPGLGTIIQKERANLLSQVSRISRDLKKYNYDIQPMERDLSSTLSSDISSVENDLRKKYLNSCFVDTSKGVAIDVDKIINRITQPSTNNSPMAINGYRTALRNIMASDESISTKLSMIEKLENEYRGMVVTYTDSTGYETTDTPFRLFTKTYNNCQNKYNSDYSSDAKKVKSLLNEYKTITDSFPSNIGNKIKQTLINCNGEDLKPTDSCTENTLNPASQQNFCLAKANTCANNMNACYQEINKGITDRTNKMKLIAGTFNANVLDMVNKSRALYKSQAANVELLVKNLQQRFPGSNFEIPTDMNIADPQLSTDKFGIEVFGNGDIEKITAELPQKLDLLKQMFANSKNASDQAMDEYIGLQKANIEKEKSKFASMQKHCAQVADASNQAIAKSGEQGAKTQSELDSKVKSFCRKYDNLRNSPVPSCDNAKKLADDIDAVAVRITQKTAQMAQAYATTCDQFNSEDSSTVSDCLSDYDSLKSGRRKFCDAILGKAAKNSEKTNSDSKKSPNKNKLSSYCPNAMASNTVFVNKVLKKMNDTDKENLPLDDDKIDTKKILDSLKKGSSYGLGDEESFFSKFAKEFPEISKSDKICESILNQGKVKAKKEEEKKNAESALAELDNKIKEKDEIKNEKDSNKKEQLISAEKAKDDYKKALENFETKKKDLEKIDENQKDFGQIFDEYIAHSDDESSEGNSSDVDPKTLAFRRLGEQATGSCDSESNINSNIGKNPLNFDVNAYDKKFKGGVTQ